MNSNVDPTASPRRNPATESSTGVPDPIDFEVASHALDSLGEPPPAVAPKRHRMKTAAASANATLNHLASRSGVTPLVKRHPYGLAGMAFGLGYVVSGGFLTPSTGRILGMAVSLTAIPAVRERLIQLIDSALAPTT